MTKDLLKVVSVLGLMFTLIVFSAWAEFSPRWVLALIVIIGAFLSVIYYLADKLKDDNEPVIIADDMLIHENNILRQKLMRLNVEHEALQAKLLSEQAKNYLKQVN